MTADRLGSAPMGQLSEVTRRRIATLVLLAGLMVAALAIADEGPFSNPPTQEERAQAAVVGFFEAARAKDFNRMCDLLTPATRIRVLQRTAALTQSQEDVGHCSGALAEQERLLTAQVGETLGGTRIAEVKDSRVSGNRAAVDVVLRFPQAKRPVPRTFQLELVDGDWKISSSVL